MTLGTELRGLPSKYFVSYSINHHHEDDESITFPATPHYLVGDSWRETIVREAEKISYSANVKKIVLEKSPIPFYFLAYLLAV